MNDSGHAPEDDDTEGHTHLHADVEKDEGDDTEGHTHLHADAEKDEDDVEGHQHRV